MDIEAPGVDIEVKPAALRHAGVRLSTIADAVRGDLTTAYHAVAPDSTANPQWATTVAGDAVTAAAAGLLAQLAGRGHVLADALGSAADAYERVDDEAAGRLSW